MKKLSILLLTLLLSTSGYSAIYFLSNGSFESQVPPLSNGDIIVIPAGVTVTSASNITFPDVILNIQGSLIFMNTTPAPVWTMGSGGVISVTGSGTITGNGSHNNQIIIGTNVVFYGDGPVVTGTRVATSFTSGFMGATPLPLRFTGVTANVRGAEVLVEWTVADDSWSHVFTVERSADGKSWYPVHVAMAQQRGNQAARYSYTDAVNAPGTYYYRIDYTGSDGVNGYSSVTVANVNKKRSITAGVADHMLQVRYATGEPKTLAVTDMLGRVLINRTVAADETETKLSLPQPGTYIVHVREGAAFDYVQKVVNE